MEKNLGLYLHIPFCVSKCAYCDFLSFPISRSTPQQDLISADVVSKYVAALIKEIGSCQTKEFESYQIDTIFMGGGTPSILAGKEIEGIFQALQGNFFIAKDAEISIEVNPGTVTKEKVKVWKDVGINRLSIGLQSVNDDELKVLGRVHTFRQFQETYALAREAGFHNINIDLISGIPGQTLDGFLKTLEKVGKCSPEHISAYSLIIEEETPFGKRYGERRSQEPSKDKGILPLPSEDVEWAMYQQTEDVLSSFGYQRYEISNYAKEGFICKHNTGYWERKDYLGVGLGAASLFEDTRFQNVSDLEVYLERIKNKQSAREESDTEVLSLKAQMDEFIFLGLRQIKGVSKAKFQQCFGEAMEAVYQKSMRKLVREGLLIVEGDKVSLTKRGIDISNTVFVEFLAEE